MIDTRLRAALDAVAAELLGMDDVPERASATWIAERFHVTEQAVRHAVSTGRLPSEHVPGTRRNFTVSVADAVLIWGYRLLAAKDGGR